MTELTGGVDESRENAEALDKLDINSLRSFAKLMGITSDRAWGKEDYVKAIQRKRESMTVSVVLDGGSAPKPGHSRILMHRDTSPGHKNGPVHVAVNGNIFSVPRGVEVDVPSYLVNALKDAVSIQTVHIEDVNGPGHYVESPQISYPFSVLAATPGEVTNQHDPRAQEAALRAECKDYLGGKWATEGEYREWLKVRMHKKMNIS